MADQQTIRDFIAGDTKAFERLFREYARSMQLTALGICPDTDVAEDAVQESFVYLWEHRGDIRPDLSVENYLHTCVRHYVLNHLRHEHIRREREEDIRREMEWTARHSEDEAEFEFRLQAVRQMVETLPESCRKIFVMAVVEGWGYAATASELGLSVNTVKSQVKIAYRKLKSNLREHPGGACLALLMWLCERG